MSSCGTCAPLTLLTLVANERYEPQQIHVGAQAALCLLPVTLQGPIFAIFEDFPQMYYISIISIVIHECTEFGIR